MKIYNDADLTGRRNLGRVILIVLVVSAVIFTTRTGYGDFEFSSPVTLNTNASSDSGDDDLPQVTTDGAGNWVAVWGSSENLGGTAGTDWDIFVSRSTDNGATWTAPVTLNTNPSGGYGDNDESPQVTTDGVGNWVAVWDSLENFGGTISSSPDIFVSRSTDNGATWTTLVTLYTITGFDWHGYDKSPQVTTDGVGNWVAVWYSDENLGGTAGMDRDIFVSTIFVQTGVTDWFIF